eukprot:5438355-Amphidinium_carterae.1
MPWQEAPPLNASSPLSASVREVTARSCIRALSKEGCLHQDLPRPWTLTSEGLQAIIPTALLLLPRALCPALHGTCPVRYRILTSEPSPAAGMQPRAPEKDASGQHDEILTATGHAHNVLHRKGSLQQLNPLIGGALKWRHPCSARTVRLAKTTPPTIFAEVSCTPCSGFGNMGFYAVGCSRDFCETKDSLLHAPLGSPQVEAESLPSSFVLRCY